MILLDTSTTLEVVLDGSATTEMDFAVTYIDTSDDSTGHNDGTTNDTTDVIVVSAPGSGTRLIRSIHVYNADNVSHTVTLKLDDGVNERILISNSLLAGKTLVYDSESGWDVAFNDTSSWDGNIADINLDGSSDIGAALADADLMLVDDGASGTNRKSAMSRMWTYIWDKIKAVTDISSVNWVLDEDDMASDSATDLATQQSIKKYIDDNAGGSGGGLTWSVISTDTNASTDSGYLIDASGGNVTLTLPVSPSEGDTIGACDYNNSASINTITIDGNGNNIEGTMNNLVLDIDGAGFTFVYTGVFSSGWDIITENAGRYSLTEFVQTAVTVTDGAAILKKKANGAAALKRESDVYSVDTNKTVVINVEIMCVVNNDFDIATWQYKIIAQNNGVVTEIVKIRDGHDGTTKEPETYYTGNIIDETLGEAEILLCSGGWDAKASNRSWYGVTMSSTGQYQTAVDYGGQIYISDDFGATWTAKESNRIWNGVTMSSTGQYQTAVVTGGQIYISDDFGATWTAKESNRSWHGVTMSSTGQYQTAVVNDGFGSGQIYISDDFGATWTAKESNRYWNAVAMSSTGQYQTAVVNDGQIYISKSFGDYTNNSIIIVCKNELPSQWNAHLSIQDLTGISQPISS